MTTADRIPLVVLLVSKCHAHLLHEGHEFCSRLLSRSVHGVEGQQVDLLAGVVDGVTYPKSDQIGKHERLSELAKLGGFEGVSVWVAESEVAAPPVWSTPEWTENRTSTSTQQRCTISFQFQSEGDHKDTLALSPNSRSQTTTLLQLPVANTLFQNGLTSTLFAQRWVMTGMSTSRPELHPMERTRLPHQALRMTDFSPAKDGKAMYSLETRLKPITPPRVIAASFGNIIRTLQSGDANGIESSVPASTELEGCVSQWMQTGDLTNQQAQVWALVTPRENWVDRPGAALSNLQSNFDSGSRLHKVLSGGGGWGKKKGLLALDPDSEYSRVPKASPQVTDIGDTMEEQAQRQGIGEVVRPGDMVVFYVYDAPNPPESHSAHSSNITSWYIRSPASTAFGTIPSSIDSMPGAGNARADRIDVDYIFARNHFGMVSEQGMALRIARLDQRNRSLRSAEQAGAVVVQTKLDCPYTQFSTGYNTPSTINEISSKTAI